MRTPRVVILAASFITSITLIIISLRSPRLDREVPASTHGSSRGGIHALFSFNTPLSLFPPNAIISLTDDNTTSFLARPAAFGPLLPTKGLSGQLWIGSGFGDDSLRQGAIAVGAEGELGCSDVPGWMDGSKKSAIASPEGNHLVDGKSPAPAANSNNIKRSDDVISYVSDRTAVPDRAKPNQLDDLGPLFDDGTDDYLHHPLPGSIVSKPSKPGQESYDLSKFPQSNHADIQSIQEGAEIAGKIVILSRGGCGFLEKVKWVQRRGGIALIVGDDTRGGPLIQMYARGDTSNVTIPSVFTSHTTAHLLSSLIPPGSLIEETVDENGKAAVKVHQSGKSKKSGKKGAKRGSQPMFTPTTALMKATSTSKPTSKPLSKKPTTPVEGTSTAGSTAQTGWFRSLFWKPNSPKTSSDTTRPKNGKLDWILVDDWDDKEIGAKKPSSKPAAAAGKGAKSHNKDTNVGKQASKDDFVIGVQDWRDPDLVGGTKDSVKLPKVSTKSTGKATGKAVKNRPHPTNVAGKKPAVESSQDLGKVSSSLRGGSITPGSGEYEDGHIASKSDSSTYRSEDKDSGLLAKLFGEDDEESEFGTSGHAIDVDGTIYIPASFDNGERNEDDHEGLWVTLTPTNGASPFFDTLLVLVVSPLVTLTVVYALLMLRSRIRRRRWRAPKSVVERLPVRTYQTIASSSSGSRQPSPNSSSPSTPLLQQGGSRPRPRSRTTSGLPEPGNLSRSNSDSSQLPRVPSQNEHEKPVASEWKKYMGKQVECVVCLEEYIDGVSQVMSLPCGHEFHVDCITPWLTTRRRTCPICKGDVVRSVTRASASSPRYESYHDDSDDGIQIQASEASNDLPSDVLPIVGDEMTGGSDLERGIVSPTPSRQRRNFRPGSWRDLLPSGLGSASRTARSSHDDRSR